MTTANPRPNANLRSRISERIADVAVRQASLERDAATDREEFGGEPADRTKSLIPVMRMRLTDIVSGTFDPLEPSSWITGDSDGAEALEFDADGDLSTVHDVSFSRALSRVLNDEGVAEGQGALLLVEALHVRALRVSVANDGDADEVMFVPIGPVPAPLVQGHRYASPEFLAMISRLAHDMQEATPNSIG